MKIPRINVLYFVLFFGALFYLIWVLGYFNLLSISIYQISVFLLSLLYVSMFIMFILIRIKDMIFSNKAFMVLFAINVAFILFTFAIMYIKYLTYNATAWDLGIYEQILYSTAYYHKLFYYTVELFAVPSGSFLGTHFSPILFFIVPFYVLYPHALTLLLIQGMLISAASFMLYVISKDLLKDNVASLLIAFSFLLNPGVGGLLFFDFHVEAFIPLIYFLIVFSLIRRKWVSYFIGLVSFLLIIEFNIYIMFMFILVLLLFLFNAKDLPRETKAVVIVGSIVVFLAFFMLIPYVKSYFNPHVSSFAAYNPASIAGYSGNVFGFINYLKSNIRVILRSFITRFSCKVKYYLLTSAPLFGSLIDPLWLLPALPYIVFSMLSTYGPYFSIPYQYAMYFLPQLFVASVFGFSRISFRRRLAAVMFAVSVFVFLIGSPFSPFANPNFYVFISGLRSSYVHFLNIAVDLVPNYASVLTVNNLFPHVANRLNAYVVPYSLGRLPGYIVNSNIRYVLVNAYSYIWGGQLAASYALGRGFGLVVDADGVYLFERGYSGAPLLTAPLHMILPASSFFFVQGSPVRVFPYSGVPGGVVYYWPSNVSGGVFWFGPYLILMPGSYVATVYLMIDRPCNGTLLTLGVSNNAGAQVLVSRTIYCSDFPKPFVWVAFKLPFNVTSPALTIEIRGLNPTGASGIYFGYVVLNETKIFPYINT